MAFHYIFGRRARQQNVVHLLNAILAETEAVPIQDVVFEETSFTPEVLGLKGCRLDLRAKTDLGRQIAIEVQILDLGNMEERSLYYWSRLFTDQLKAGEDYRTLDKTIAINLLDFPFQKTQKVRTVGRIADLDTGETISDLLEIHFLSLPMLSRETADLSCPLTRWLLFLDHRTEPSVREESTLLDDGIRKATKDLERLKSDREARRFYELREKALLDERSARAFFREEGREEGRKLGKEEGRKIGKEEGRRVGRDEGRTETKAEIALSLLKEGMTEEFVSKVTGLELAAIRKLNGM